MRHLYDEECGSVPCDGAPASPGSDGPPGPNPYDDERFFEKYSRMPRSVEGLCGAGEWHALRRLLPALTGARVLDLGCGFGWHCRYAAEHGAASVLGIDLSEKMLERARQMTQDSCVAYRRCAIESYDYPADTFDLVLSSLALHYVRPLEEVCRRVCRTLRPGGRFVFSVEHPVFTAQGPQDWVYDAQGRRLYWPVDRYFEEGARRAVFLGETMTKYHRTLTTYVRSLQTAGLTLTALVEPEPDPALLDRVPELHDELRRPMMLLCAAQKP